MSAAIMLARPIGAVAPSEYSRVVFSELEAETVAAVNAARAPEGSDLHRNALIEHYRGQVAAGAHLPFDPEFRSDAWAEAAVEALALRAEDTHSKVEQADERVREFEVEAASLDRPRSRSWRVFVTAVLLLLTAGVAFASARLVAPTLDVSIGGYFAAAYQQDSAGTAHFMFLIAVLISGVVTGAQVIAVLMTSGRLGALSKCSMFLADLLVAGAFFGMRWSAGSNVQSAALVLLEVAVLVVFSSLLLGASVVLRKDADRRDTWTIAATHLGVLQHQVERKQKQHAEVTARLSDQVQVFEEREAGVRRAKLTERMVEATTNASYLTAQAELVAKMMEAE